MDGPGAGTGSIAGGGGPAPAGAVVVPVEAAAAPVPAARPPAPPAGRARRPAWTWVDARVTFAPPPPAAAVVPRAARGPPPPPAAPAARSWAPAALPVAWTRLNARLAWAAALFLLGCAVAGLAFFAMILPSADSLLGKKACKTTDAAEVASLRAGSEQLLLAGAAQVVVATMALLVPVRPVAVFGLALGWLTAYRATDVLWMVVVTCHGGTVHGWLAFHFYLFLVVLAVASAVAAIVSTR